MTHAALCSLASAVLVRTRCAVVLAVVLAGAFHVVVAGQQAGTNVNIVKGTSLPGGDPFLQRQTEPSVAISTRNPCHLVASAVDYRTVDLEQADDANPTQLASGDAWLGFYKSFDCGQRWQSHLIPGYPNDKSAEGMASPLHGFEAGADGVVRAGSNGLFYYVGMVFQRDQSASKVFVSRFIDSNNKERGDTIEFAGTSVVASGDTQHFLDKPWIGVDIPRKALTVTARGRDGERGRDDDRDQDGVCVVNGQRVAAGNVYVGWTNFDVTTTTETSRIMFARSATCGRTWQQRSIFEHRRARPAHRHESHRGDRDFDSEDEDNEASRVVQGTAIAIAPADGAVYVVWRQFARNGLPSGIFVAKSTDGGSSFSAPRQLALINGFDQERGLTTFRTNAMPTIAADQAGRVYVAWAERGYASMPGRGDKLTGDSRIMLSLSPDRGRTWLPRYAIDNSYVDDAGMRRPLAGHQLMPSLSVAAGKLHVIWYDFRSDPCLVDPAKAMQPSCGSVNGVPNYEYIDGIDHLVTVQSATAAIGIQPAFTSVRLSQFPRSIDADGKVHEKTSHANLPLYSAGTKSFLGDYIDAAALTAIPTRSAKNVQEWLPNTGVLTTTGGKTDPSAAPMAGFATLPIFQGVWTDTRDVRPPQNGDWTLYFPPRRPSTPAAACNPDTAGMRDANIYSSRLTPGVYVGSPSNAKPLGFVTRDGVRQHLQRAFVVFIQNPLRETRYYRLTIVNQPGAANTDRASFNQFPSPPFTTTNPSDKLHDPRIPPLITAWVAAPPISTVSRNVYVTAADPTAQVRVDVEETDAPLAPVPGQPAPTAAMPPLKANGLRSSILLNPDPTSPALVGPDLVGNVPDIAELEVHEPVVDDPIFFNVNDPRTRSTALRTPADQNPADQNPADQNPSDQNITDLNPADQNPADQNPADQNPADQNPAVEAVAFGDEVTGTGTLIRDVHFPVRNNGNTTTRYFFRPVVKSTSPDRKYQLLVTVRNNTLTVDDACNLKIDPQREVLVNVSNFRPRTPADQNPADQNPADQNPADQNPADQNPADQNPAEQNPADQNPADQNTSFFLAPGDEATVTLRIYAPSSEFDALPSPGNDQVAAVVASASANTGETVAPTAAAGADLTVNEPPAVLNVEFAEPGQLVDLSWTLKNRGTSPAASTNGSITTQFYLSTNTTAAFTPGDVLLASTSREGDIPACTATAPTGCAFAFVQPLTIPPTTTPSATPYFIKVITDPPNGDFPTGRVFEADETNNVALVQVTVAVINNPPTFTIGPNQSLLRSAGAQTVDAWATNISAGPADEAAQTVNFVVTTDNTALFSVQPAITPAGTLTFTPAAAATGSATLTVRLHDSGGTLFGGVDTSAPQTFVISVTAVNDAPSFSRGGDQTALEDAGAQSVPNWATNISAGPADEAGQLVDFRVSADNPALFAISPAISPSGTLSYTPAANANGTASVTVQVHDNGGTANGGVDTSAPQTFTISVTAVNDAPSFTNGADQTVPAGAGPQIVADWATSISAGPQDEAGQGLEFFVVAANPALFSTPPAVSPSGTLTYTPLGSATGSTLVTVRLHDAGGTANGGVDASAPQTFTITLAASAPTANSDSFATFEDIRLPVSACTAPIDYAGFAASSPFLSLAGDAAYTATDADGSVLRLISALTPEGAFNFGARGGVWTRPPVSLANFHTTFTFRMSGGAAPFAPDPSTGWDGQGLGPDGLVLVLQNSDAGVNALGGSGGALLSGITPSVGIEFDTFQSTEFADPDSNHIGIDINGSNVSVATTAVATRFDDGSLWTAWVDYDGTTLEVRASPDGVRPDAPNLTYPINLPAILGPSATAGFVAADGSNVANADLVSWSSACTTLSLLRNDTDPNGRTLTASLVTPPSNGVATVNADGTFSYTPEPNFFGGDSFTYRANNGTTDSAPAVVTVIVNAVNDPPSFVKGPDQTAAADGLPRVISPWATAISAGPANESGQSVFFVVSNDNNALFATQPAVEANTGTLSFTPKAGASGTAVVTVEARDNGGSASGGINTSAPQTFTITVTAVVNRTPTAADDTATTTENGAATIAVLANDSDPDGDPLTVTNVSEPAFGTAVVNADKTITYTPAFEFSGADAFSYSIGDGRGATATATVRITVIAVNDAPTFTKAADQTVAEDAGAHAVPNWATNISAGDSDDAGQAVNFVTSNDNAALFAAEPAIDPDGTLHFTSASNAYGTATVTVRLHDDGGIANGGIDTSAAQVFTITVTPVNDPPVANDDLAPPATRNLPLDIDVTANDSDVDNATGGTIVASHAFSPASIGSPGELAVDMTSGHVYVQAPRFFGAVDTMQPSDTAIVATIATRFGTSIQHRVDPATRLIYFRAAFGAQNLISVLDPASNQIVGTLSFTTISGFVIDSLRSRLYVTASGQLLQIDALPTSPTFLQTLAAMPLGSASAVNALAFNATANRLYIAAGSGVWVVDATTGALTQIANAPVPSSEIAVDETHNRVFAAGTNGTSTTVAVIDGATNAVGGVSGVPGVVNNGSTSRRLVVNASSGTAYLRTSDAAFTDGWVVAIDSAATATSILLGARETGAVAIVSDDALNRIVTIASGGLQLIVIDGATGLVTARLHTSQPVANTLEIDPARHRAYASVFGSIVVVDTQAQTIATLPLATEAAAGFVNSINHTLYLATLFGQADINAYTSDGQATPVTNLPHHDGRWLFFGRDRSSNLFYVANNIANATATNSEPGFVAEIDGVSNQVTQTIDAGSAPFGLVVNSTTHKVYVGNTPTADMQGGLTEVTPAAHTSAPIDVSTLHNTSAALSIGRSMAVNEATNRIYFQILGGSTASGAVVDAANGNAVSALPLSGTWGTIREFEVDKGLNRIFVATDPVDATPGRLHVLDGTTHEEVAFFDIFSATTAAGTQTGVAVDDTRHVVFVSDFLKGTVSVVDATSNVVKATLPVCARPGAIGINKATNRAYVTCAGDRSSLAFIDGNGPGGSYRIVGYLQLPVIPSFAYVDEGVSLVYVTNNTVGAPVLTIVRDMNGALDGVLSAATASTPTAQGGTTAINANGTVHYVPPPDFTGTDTFTYTATDGQAISNTATVTVHVFGEPVITTASPLPAATVNQPYSYALSVSSALPVTWYLPTNLQLPLGLSLNGAGVISGTPTQLGVFSFLVEVADTEGSTTQATLTLAVNGPALQITTATLRDAVVIENYGNTIAASGGAGTRSFSIESGSLPTGIILNSNGSLSGTPTRTGTFAFVVKAVDCAASSCAAGQTPQRATRALTLRVDAREQQSATGTEIANIPFGGPGGRRLAQVVTVEAQGSLAGVGFLNPTSCPSPGTVTIEIQRLTLAGLPDGHTIASGTALSALFTIPVAPAIDFPVGAKFAFIVSSTTACTASNGVTDSYQGGDAYADAGSGWQPLIATDGRYDLAFRTLIQPALPVAYLSRFRGDFTATVLSDGRVLLAGNDATADLYDPATNTVTLTGSMSQPRSGATGTLLPDGKIMIAGGFDFAGNTTATTDIYDPASGTFTPGPVMSVARRNHRATALVDGRVLITGGNTSDGSALQSAEIYDPAQSGFTTAGDMVTTRTFHTATLLQSGKVLVAAGYNNTITAAELFDPTTNTFSPTSGSMVVPFRGRATATLLLNGQVLIAGGQANDIASSAEIYDPTADAFSATGAMSTPRFAHTATPLADGSVLIAGGADQAQVQSYIPPLATLERYVPESGTFVPAGGLEAVRDNHVAALLNDGGVLFAGGFSQSFMTGNVAEIYDRATVPFLATTTLPDAPLAVSYPSTTLVAGGGSGGPYEILNFGGLPPGISYDPNTFTLTGVPTQTGVFALGFKVIDNQAHSGVETLTLRVGSISRITSPYRLIDAALNRPYDLQLTATGTMPIVWSLVPASQFDPLPAGLTLSGDGRITGAPTALGYYNFAVRAVDATGQQAIKTLAIFVRDALQITTASALDDGTLFDFYFACLNSFQGTGFHTWTVTSGELPRGVTLQPFGCLAGQVASLGTFTFTAQVADESSPPQIESRTFTIAVSTAIDQGSGGDTNQPALSFGGPVRIAQHVTTGISGPLNAFRVFGVSCPVGATITGEIQGLTPSGAPDGTVLAAGTAVSRFSNETITIGLSNPLRYAADAAFALVLSADQTCDVHPAAFDSYGGGDAFVSTSTTWRSLREVDGRHDLPFETVITPPPTLGYTTEFRAAHSATVLQDGRVLLAGGSNSNTAEIYDPVTRLTTATAGSMSVARRDHVATLLDDGTVLITGGWETNTNTYLSSAELFHPDTATFELLASSMSVPRTTHTATTLGDGRVLIAGGQSGQCCSTDLASAELYNPASRTFTAIAPMNEQRRDPTATLLLDGRVLIAGGYGTGFGNAEIFDPTTSTFAFPLRMPVRAQHTATRLADGRVLLAGGAGDLGNPVTTAVVFDPTLGTFTPTGPMATPHVFTTATALTDGSVIVAGGATENACCDGFPPHPTLERYLPASNSWVGAGSLLVNRYFHTASGLADGTVLFAGTFGWSVSGSRSLEIYDPATAVSLVDATPPAGRTGEPYDRFSFAGQGGSGGPYSITQTGGVLPPGLVYDSETHDLSGTPTASGAYTPVFTVADTFGHANSQTVLIAIDPLVITAAAVLPEATFGQPYTATLTATGIGASTWTIVSGILPPGLSLVGNLITGTPTVSCCFYGFTVRAVDAAGQVATLALGINVREALAITTTVLPDAIATGTYFGCLNSIGGVPPFTWTLSDNGPQGLALFPGSSCFDGAFPEHQLLEAGVFDVTATVTDSSALPHSASRTLSLRVGAFEQSIGSSVDAQTVPLSASRRVAQIVRSATPFSLLGVQPWSLGACTENTVITATVWPVTGAPSRPNESGDPLAAASVTVESGGFFNSTLSFAQPVAIPQHGEFAVVLSFAGGSCQGSNWPRSDAYTQGAGFVSDAGGPWQLLSTALGVYDVPMNTIILPARDSFSFLRGFHPQATAVTLASGRVLLIDFNGNAEIYDPTTTPPTVTPAGTTLPRYGATATLMPNGKVVIVGGQSFVQGEFGGVKRIDVFDENAAGDKFSLADDVPLGHWRHTATLLRSGKLLVAGGWGLSPVTNDVRPESSAYVIDENGRILATLPLTGARAEHAATRLDDVQGRVLITGGWRGDPQPQTAAEMFDPFDTTQSPEGSFAPVAAPMLVWRSDHTATLINADGPLQHQVLIVGGTGSYPNLADTSELFDPASMQFTAAPDLKVRRLAHTATELADGRIVIAGGDTTWFNNESTSSVEVFDSTVNAFARTRDLLVDRAGHSTMMLRAGSSAGRLLVAGGFSTSHIPAHSVEIVNPAATTLVITTSALPDGSVNHAYPTTPVFASGGSGAGLVFSIGWGQLPPGLSLNGDTIAGTPLVGGPFSFVVKATDSAGGVAYQEFTIYVDRLTVTSPSSLPSVLAGSNYGYQLTATGVAPFAWSLEPGYSLPPDLTLSSDGRFAGIATTPGFYFFAIRVRDAANQATSAFFSLQVETTLTISTTTLRDAIAPQFYFGCLQSVGGSFPQSWTTTGMLPPDVVLNQFGCFDGQVVKTGTYTFSATVSTPAQPATSSPLTIRSGTVDQAVWSIDETSPFTTVAFGGPIAAAQVFTPQINGNLISMQLPVACTSGVLRLEIRGTTDGEPNSTIYSAEEYGLAELTPFQPGAAYHRQLRLSTPAFMSRGTPVAAVVSSTGSCDIVVAPADSAFQQFSYPFGDGFTGSTGAWTRLAADRPDLPFNAVIDDGGRFALLSQWGVSFGSATLLDSGLVLLLGGYGNANGLYNPTAAPLRIADSLDPPRFVNPGRVERLVDLAVGTPWHTATKLRDGRVLIAGGLDPAMQVAANTARIYDPSTATFSDPIPMRSARITHTATLLSNGDVLLVGGHAVDFSTPGVASTEVFHYDATTHTGTFVDGPTLNAGRAEAAAVLLASDGGPDRVLVTGGWGVPDAFGAEIIVGASSVTVAAPLQANRVVHTMTLLECATTAPCSYGGLVLVAGGFRPDNSGMVTTAELFDPASNQFTTVATTSPRANHTATRTNGGVLLAGGTSDRNGFVATTEMFSPLTRSFVAASDMIVARNAASAVRLPDDTVFIVGGPARSDASCCTSEIFNPLTDRGGLGAVGDPFTMTVPTGGVPPFNVVVRAGLLPDGLSLDATAGVIGGTPTVPGVTRLVFEIGDSSNLPRHTFREVTITITATTIVQSDNRAPIAADDPVTTGADSQIVITVLANDSDPDGDPLTVTSVSSPSSGTAVLQPGNTIAYTPNAGFTGGDAFSYAITDGRGGTAIGHVTVTVTPAAARSNNAGPGAAIVSFFNPASTGDPAAVPGFGTLTAVSFFNPAAVPSAQPPRTQSAAAASVSFVNGPNPTPAQTPTSTNAAAPSVSFVNGANPTAATATPTASNAAAPAVSFVNGASPTPAVATPMMTNAAAAPVSFANGTNLDPSGTFGVTTGSRVAVVTVAAGPTITGVSPPTVSISAPQPVLVLTGGNFANVTTIAFDDPAGILVGAFAVSDDGHTLTIPLMLQPTTPLRTVLVAVSGSDGSSVVTSATVFTLVP